MTEQRYYVVQINETSDVENWDLRCYGCNWDVARLYQLQHEEEAYCAACFVEHLMVLEARIALPKGSGKYD